jgi:hypothetical protein
MSFTTIISEGNLIPADLLAQIADGAAAGQKSDDFGFDKARRLTDEIAAAWSDAREYWSLFQRRVETLTRQGRLREDDPATSLTREFWVERLLETLGYQLTPQRSAAVVNQRTYFVSHRAGDGEDAPPIHIEGFRTRLDQRPTSGRPRLSSHALVQEYLNSAEHLWGIVTNGERLRLLRDSSRTTRPSFVEFDLRGMLEGEQFAEFAILYRLLHRSRLPQSADDGPKCLLETYHQQAIEAGGRVREGLRDGVELALRALGTGLLQHDGNAALRARVASGQLAALDYYRQLLRLVYRLLFLMVAEERRLISPRQKVKGERQNEADALTPPEVEGERGITIFYAHYSVGRLRRLAEQPGTGHNRHGDLWLGLLATFRVLRDEDGAQALGIQPLDGDLFGPGALPDLEDTRLANDVLLRAVRALSLYRDPQTKSLRRVNYAALDVEELGSVYESLLDYRPVVEGKRQKAKGKTGANGALAATADGSTDVEADPFAFSLFTFDLASGSERKTTGSYYTRPELVHELIKSALEPVMEQRLAAAGSVATKRAAGGMSPQEAAILSIRVCDPACGSGHFLLAAARRLGRELARVRSGEDQPGPDVFRLAVRDAVRECIYGVDVNPLAVDLCKVALWIESLSPGMPLSFLDSHIRWGNSLIGATRALVDQGIPDDAYKPVTGDDKAVASAFRKRNARERKAQESGQLALGLDFGEHRAGEELFRAAQQLDAMPDNSVGAVRARAAAFEQLRARGSEWWDEWTRFNLWTAAFFTPLTAAADPTVPTTQALVDFARNPAHVRGDMAGKANALALELGFFHWELEFPQVFDRAEGKRQKAKGKSEHGDAQVPFGGGGFDVVLGNPPWERIKLQEQEHFVDVPEITGAANKAAREKVIQAWRQGDERQRARIAEFDAAKYRAEAESRFVRASERFPLTAVGDVNTYALFAEHARDLLAPTGRAGIIVPTGIATDDTTKVFFNDLVHENSLASLYDFENREGLFVDVAPVQKFCLLTLRGESNMGSKVDFVFFVTNTTQLSETSRRFQVESREFSLLNPNTLTSPICRTKQDFEIMKRIYSRVPIMVNEVVNQANPWSVSFFRMFDMASNSGSFKTQSQLIQHGLKLESNCFIDNFTIYLPLYEAKFIQIYDHRHGGYDDAEAEGLFRARAGTSAPKVNQKSDPKYVILPRYWVNQNDVSSRAKQFLRNKWLIAFRDVVRPATDTFCSMFAFLPLYAIGHKAPILIPGISSTVLVTCLVSCLNSLVVDFVAKQKIGGTSLSYFILKQLPVLPPSTFTPADIAFIVPRVVELVYTAWDIKAFAEDVWAEAGSAVVADRRVRPHGDDTVGTAGGVRGAGMAGRTQGSPVHGAGSAGGAGGADNAVGANLVFARNDTDAGGDGTAGDADIAGMAGRTQGSPVHDAGVGALTPLQAELLRRNIECNADADPALFAPRDGFPLPPYRWDEGRRALARAELDARIARLYGLTRDELRYILDPHDVHGPDFPGETFRVLKEKEIRQFGEYRTRRLVLEAWDREEGQR